MKSMYSVFFQNKINELQENENIKNLFQQLSEIGQFAILGGALRDWIFNLPPKDIDIVIDCSKEELKFLKKHFAAKQNAFEGYKLEINSTKFDIWSLDTTWAFKQDNVLEKSLAGVLNTVFFNYDAISYNYSSKEVLDNNFFKAFSSKVLDIIYKPNLFPMNITSKALFMAHKYELNFSDKLIDYVKEQIDLGYNERDEYGHVWELGWQESDRPHPGFGGTTDICGGYIEQCKRCGMYGYEFCPGSGRDSQYAFQKCGSKIR